MDIRIQGFRETWIHGYMDTWIQGYRDIGTQRNKDTGYKDTRIQGSTWILFSLNFRVALINEELWIFAFGSY